MDLRHSRKCYLVSHGGTEARRFGVGLVGRVFLDLDGLGLIGLFLNAFTA